MKWWYILLGLIGFYGLAMVLLNVFLGKMLFLPQKLNKDYDFEFDFPYEELWLSEENLTIHGIFFPTPDSSKGLILYFHGNADNLQRWGQYTVDFTSLGYDVMAIDYPGYGKSPGAPSEEGLYQSAELAYEWALESYAKEDVIFYGRSMGSGPASYLSSRYPARMLILETPFHSVPDVLRERNSFVIWWNNAYQFPNDKHLQLSDNLTYIFQGTADRIVPYSSAVKLKPFLQSEDQFIVIEGGKHKNLREFELYHEKLREILGER